jgi:putative flippase GtrA
MIMLLEAGKAGYPLREVPIDTVYLNENRSSHFRPFADSARVYIPFLKFVVSSGLSAIFDFLLLFILHFMSSNLLLSVVGARLGSSLINYTLNRKFVFTGSTHLPIRKTMVRYYSLVLLILSLNYGLMYIFYAGLTFPLIVAKLLTEASLFLFSYWAQRKFVYGRGRDNAA